MTPIRTLTQLFAATVARYPEHVALEVAGIRLTYRELDRAARRAGAALLAAVGGQPPRRVALVASRSPVAYAVYLAAQQLGATIVPLSCRQSSSRAASACASAGVGVVVADDAGAAVAAALRGKVRPDDTPLRVLDLSGEAARTVLEGLAPRLAEPPADPDAEAYILFTSGSTGRPKGVPIRHGNVVPYVKQSIERYGAGPGSRLSQTFDLTFDPSVFDLFVAWGSGAALVVPDKEELLDPVSFVSGNALTHWFSVPSVIGFARRLGRLRPDSMPTLRHSLFAGEQLTLAQAGAWRGAAPNGVIGNLYGPTELTVTCLSRLLPAAVEQWPSTPNGTVPIGTANPGLEALVVDEHGLEAEEGELLVRGPQRFHGYLDARDNQGRFAVVDRRGMHSTAASGPISPDLWYRTGDLVGRHGTDLVHLGRVDDQVKIRGHRIEPGEVEAVMRRHPHVHDAAAFARTAEDGERELVVAYTGLKLRRKELVAVARQSLPEHMLPDRYVHLSALPLGPNGKLDRKSLPSRLGPAAKPAPILAAAVRPAAEDRPATARITGGAPIIETAETVEEPS